MAVETHEENVNLSSKKAVIVKGLCWGIRGHSAQPQQKVQLCENWAGNQVWRPRLVCSGKLWINVCSHSSAAPEKHCSSAHHPRNGFGRKLLRRKRREGCGARAAWAVPMQTNLHQDTSLSSCCGSATCKETTAPREITILL